MQLYGLTRTEAGRRASELLAALELQGEAGKLVQDYSHGMKKRLALGCALIHGPRLLFLDEPFEGIDALAVAGLRRLLQDLVARGGMTIFLTSHVLEVVERLVTHVGIINHGRLVMQGTLDEVRATGTLEETFIRAVGDPHPTVLDRSVRAARCHVDGRRRAQRRHLDARAQCSLSERDVRLVVQVVTVTLETWVGFDVQVHEEPTIRPAAYARGASGRPGASSSHPRRPRGFGS